MRVPPLLFLSPTVAMVTFAVGLLVIAIFVSSSRMSKISTRGTDAHTHTHTHTHTQTHKPSQKQTHTHKQDTKFVLVLDLDETLVHSLPPDHVVVVERPHVREFLSAARAAFEDVVVFTAATRDYASPILDSLDPDGTIFGRRFSRDDCSLLQVAGDGEEGTTQQLVVKDLRKLGIPEDELGKRVRIVDNTPSAYALQPQCGVPIKSFMGDDPDDRELFAVLDRLIAEQGTPPKHPASPGDFFAQLW